MVSALLILSLQTLVCKVTAHRPDKSCLVCCTSGSVTACRDHSKCETEQQSSSPVEKPTPKPKEKKKKVK